MDRPDDTCTMYTKYSLVRIGHVGPFHALRFHLTITGLEFPYQYLSSSFNILSLWKEKDTERSFLQSVE